MASIRTLRRRLLRWQRYNARTAAGITQPYLARVPRGHTRATTRLETERARRDACPLCSERWCLGDCYELAGPPPRPIVTVHLAELS